MGIFKTLLGDIKNQDTKTLELIKDTALYVENEHEKDFSNDVFNNTDAKVMEKLLHGYMVTYSYKKKIEKMKEHGEKVYIELSIISIVQPLTGVVVTDDNVKNMISDTISRELRV